LLLISGDNTGRLLKYDPTKSNEVEVLVDGLSFANGLAMSTDGTARHGTYLLLAETTTGKILRYWIKTPKAFDLGGSRADTLVP
jgi:sugar lactone lactonase YvrE